MEPLTIVALPFFVAIGMFLLLALFRLLTFSTTLVLVAMAVLLMASFALTESHDGACLDHSTTALCSTLEK